LTGSKCFKYTGTCLVVLIGIIVGIGAIIKTRGSRLGRHFSRQPNAESDAWGRDRKWRLVKWVKSLLGAGRTGGDTT
jgi:hypothetical protein